MPFDHEIDPTRPTDADFVSEGDDELRGLKSALLERLGVLVEDPDAEPADWMLREEVIPDRGSTLVISAAEPRFAPDGTETNATRVYNAIQHAGSLNAPSTVVYIPKSMWGYSTNADFNIAMFDSNILLVREGGLTSWYDPVAYGVDLTGVTNNRAVINVVANHAKSGAGAGSKVMAFTRPGIYRKDSDVNVDGLGIITFPGAEHTGTGEFTGDPEWRWPVPVSDVGERDILVIEGTEQFSVSGASGKSIIIFDTKILPNISRAYARSLQLIEIELIHTTQDTESPEAGFVTFRGGFRRFTEAGSVDILLSPSGVTWRASDQSLLMQTIILKPDSLSSFNFNDRVRFRLTFTRPAGDIPTSIKNNVEGDWRVVEPAGVYD